MIINYNYVSMKNYDIKILFKNLIRLFQEQIAYNYLLWNSECIDFWYVRPVWIWYNCSLVVYLSIKGL